MFYCDPCARKYKWPIELWGRSHGQCEMCHEVSSCNDVPSKFLPVAADDGPADGVAP